jgi:hypothetical protein
MKHSIVLELARKLVSDSVYDVRTFACDKRILRVVNDEPLKGRLATFLKQKQYSAKWLLDQLENHLTRTGVRFYGLPFRLIEGVPQGWTVSGLLCDIYCAAFERELFHPRANELLMRIVDDYLFLTPSDTRALEFQETLKNPSNFPTYGLKANPTKFQFSKHICWYGLDVDLESNTVKYRLKPVKYPARWMIRTRIRGLILDETISKNVLDSLAEIFSLCDGLTEETLRYALRIIRKKSTLSTDNIRKMLIHLDG